MEAEEYTLRPEPPYAVTRHFELFTLPGRPVPALYGAASSGSCSPAGPSRCRSRGSRGGRR